jgi:N-acetyl sugar amidotransferase
MIKYCTNCLFPSTKPDLLFNNDGICNACTNYWNRPEIDWESRSQEFKKIVKSIKSTNYWDCVIPVSGGKDSTYQALIAKENGLNPLLVNSRTCDLSGIGRKNLDNLRGLGFDLIEVLPNPKVRSKLNLIGLQEVGDISWPEHIGMFTIPFTIALKFDIPVILYGENAQHEYGGPEHLVNNNFQDRRWLEEIGGTLGMRLEDVLLASGFNEKDLAIYKFPDSKDLQNKNIKAYYLGYFFQWNGLSNYIVSQAHGMESFGKPVEGSLVDYENLDNHQNGIHEYLKILKHGYGRITDQASILIRRGLITREEGLYFVKKNEVKFPWTYLGKRIEKIIEPLGIGIDELIEIFDSFTNKKIFKKNKDGSIFKDKDGNVVKLNYENG